MLMFPLHRTALPCGVIVMIIHCMLIFVFNQSDYKRGHFKALLPVNHPNWAWETYGNKEIVNRHNSMAEISRWSHITVNHWVDKQLNEQ